MSNLDEQQEDRLAPNAELPYSPYASVPQLFVAAARRFPHAPALVAGSVSWTYSQLLSYAHAVAGTLRSYGYGPGDMIGILAKRSPATVGGLLGVLFAGAAYLPIDPSTTPASLLSRQAKTAKVRALLCEPHLDAQIGDLASLHRLDLPPVPPPEIDLALADQVAHSIEAGAPAYVMFTSGSTGTPKGVVVPHRAIGRLVCGQNYVHFGREQTFLLHSPLNFDASTFELWGALLHGATVVLAPDRTLALADYERLIASHGVTTLWLTAATFHLLAHHAPRALRRLQQLIVGGDVISPTAVEQVQRGCPGLRIVNGYGPTECTTFALTYRVPDTYTAQNAVPIGSPLAHTSAYILGDDLLPMADDSDGQLALGGDGVALGYVNEPALTAERFVSDPFSSVPGARMYLTGDRALRDAEGLVHFLGRMDQEAKIAGHRVDPHEIEAVLSSYPGVQHAAVFVQGDTPESKRLIAACELAQESRSEADLRTYLSARLPTYALPASITLLRSMPVNANGKLDRPAILALLVKQAPHAKAVGGTQPPASRPGELDAIGTVIAIWESLLETTGISADQNFFDAGGDSLLLIQLHWRLNQLGWGNVDLMDLFSATTPRKMSGLLQQPVTLG